MCEKRVLEKKKEKEEEERRRTKKRKTEETEDNQRPNGIGPWSPASFSFV